MNEKKISIYLVIDKFYFMNVTKNNFKYEKRKMINFLIIEKILIQVEHPL